jgi:hypothetical protein
MKRLRELALLSSCPLLFACGAATPASSTTVAPQAGPVAGIALSAHADDRTRGEDRGLWLRRGASGWEWAAFRVHQTYADQRMIEAGAAEGPTTSCSAYEPVSAAAAQRLDALVESPVSDHESRGGSGPSRLELHRGGRALRVQLECDPFAPSAAADATAEGASDSLCTVARRIVALYRSRACAPDQCLPGPTECAADTSELGASAGPMLFGSRECLLPGDGLGATDCVAPGR